MRCEFLRFIIVALTYGEETCRPVSVHQRCFRDILIYVKIGSDFGIRSNCPGFAGFHWDDRITAQEHFLSEREESFPIAVVIGEFHAAS